MRFIIIVMGLLMVLPTVMAVGVLVPEELQDVDDLTIRVGAEKEYTFTLRGDAEAHDIRFFIKAFHPEDDGFLHFNGQDIFEKNMYLEIYEEETVDVEIRGKKEHGDIEFTVQYGFVYSSFNDTGIGLEQVIANTFQIKVPCSSVCDDDAPIYVPSSGSSGSGGGNRGGSNAFSTYFNIDDEEENVTDAPIFLEDDSANIQSVAEDGSALTTGVVDTNNREIPSGFTIGNSPVDAEVISDSTKEGGSLLFAVLIMMIAFMMLTGATIKVAKEVEE